MRELSKEINSLPLLNIPDNPQILLPTPEHSLLRNNFQIYSEEILNNLNRPEQNENKLEEEFGLTQSKRHSMIGLKRRDYHERPNLVMSKKKMRLSGEDLEVKIDHNKKPKHNNNINEDEIDDKLFEGEDDSLNNQGNNHFLHNDNSEMDDINYYDAFS